MTPDPSALTPTADNGYHKEYRRQAAELADTLEELASILRTQSPNTVASRLAGEWLGPLVSDLAGLAQFAELCRVQDARR